MMNMYKCTTATQMQEDPMYVVCSHRYHRILTTFPESSSAGLMELMATMLFGYLLILFLFLSL